jgi:hypothetical protein
MRSTTVVAPGETGVTIVPPELDEDELLEPADANIANPTFSLFSREAKSSRSSRMFMAGVSFTLKRSLGGMGV